MTNAAAVITLTQNLTSLTFKLHALHKVIRDHKIFAKTIKNSAA